MRRWWDGEPGWVGSFAQKHERPPTGAVRFPACTRKLIAECLQREWKKFNPDRAMNGENDLFIENLEWYAESHLNDHSVSVGTRLSSQTASEKLEAVANALDNLVGALGKASEYDCWLALNHGFGKINERPSKLLQTLLPSPLPLNYPLRTSAEGLPSLAKVAVAFRAGLPVVSSLRSQGGRYFEVQLAHNIVRSLEECGIKPSTSNTGLAGQAFAAVCDLAGKEGISAGYWLKKGISHKSETEFEVGALKALMERDLYRQLVLLAALERMS